MPTGQFHSFEHWSADSILGNYFVGFVTVHSNWAPAADEVLIDDVSVAYLDRASGIRYERVYNMEEDKLVPSQWDAYCSFAEKVLVNEELLARDTVPGCTINFKTGVITFSPDLEAGDHLKVLYSTIEENEKGR